VVVKSLIAPVAWSLACLYIAWAVYKAVRDIRKARAQAARLIADAHARVRRTSRDWR